MKIFLSPSFVKSYKKLTKRQQPLKEKIKDKLNLFLHNPLHPSLKLHRLKGKMIEDWSIAIEQNRRIIFTYIEDGILLIDVGKHEEVY